MSKHDRTAQRIAQKEGTSYQDLRNFENMTPP